MSDSIWQGERVRLRAVEPSDWETHFTWDQDTASYGLLDRIHFPKSRERAKHWAEATALREPEGDAYHFEIVDRDGALAGAIATHACDPRNGTFTYGVAVRAEHRRKGYAAAAIALVLRYYFRELRYQKVTVQVYDFNEPSQRLHERLGFQREGQLRRMIYTSGRHHDVLVYGLTAEEFAAGCGAMYIL
ncbi:MAG TPA: GNAT family protein [Ktedonobacterales bacterium]|jgi:RimJ/RimL family protein N-acetyltransferase|nr:GNAT family protein [Ktedonobacterales bacterium]